MDKLLTEKVLPIAQKVRIWAEDKAMKRKQNPDLKGWCAIASAHLLRELKTAGVDSEIHLYEGQRYCHAFVVVGDYVVDVTATQFKPFSRTPVVILHHKEAEQHEFYNSSRVFCFPSKLIDYQYRQGWPREQIAVTR